jgi:hypothetical protein
MLDPNTLASNLENMTPTGDEQAAIAAFSNAWSTYFAGASASGTPAVPGSFDTGIAAMRAAMTGFSAPNAGAPGIQAGISAFWGIISPLAATIWPLAPAVVLAAVTPPPGMSLIAADLLALFVQNLSANLSLHDAATAIAIKLHSDGGTGAFATGESATGSPVSLPIL